MGIAGIVRRWVVRHRPLQLRVQRAVVLPPLPRARRAAGSVWAVTMVRNESDIIGHTLRHLLDQGVAGVLVVDHRSTDGTPDVLREIAAADLRVHVGRYTAEAYRQGRVMSYLADRARRAGADWVIPFDADELWYAEGGTVAEYLRSIDGPRVLAAALHDGHATTPQGIELSDREGSVAVELSPSTSKVALRPHRWAWIDIGNHTALDLGAAAPSRLRILHLQYRSPAQVAAKVTVGSAAVRADREMRADIAHHGKIIADGGAAAVSARWDSELFGAGPVAELPVPSVWAGWPAVLTVDAQGRSGR